MSNIVKVQFHGDTIEAIPRDGTAWVVVRPVCDALGIDYSTQVAKLKTKAWATVGLIPMVANDGKNRELFCLDLDSLPMWLATIEPSRVRPEIRSKLERYQVECARVLRDHFFGGGAHLASVGKVVGAIAQLVDMQREIVGTMRQHTDTIVSLANRIDSLETGGGIISPQQYETIRATVARVARGRVAAGHAKSQRSASSAVYAELSGAIGWAGTGRKWRLLPAGKYAEAMATLARMQGYVEGAIEAQALARQVTLFQEPASAVAR